MELFDTVDLMNSANYKDRFIAEYYQVKVRLDKLLSIIDRYNKGILDFVPSCPISVLENQKDSMQKYVDILLERASIEGIEL